MRSRAAERARRPRPVGVLDVGSNSIRLVVFEHDGRAPVPVFNEKVLCGLGRGVATTGRLDDGAMADAHRNLARFAGVAAAMGVGRMTAVATAAVREAGNGPAFVAEVRRRTGIRLFTLSGEEEARTSALGVLSGNPDADGVMGDLGGASLELVDIGRGRTRAQVTLPLGPLALTELSGGSLKRARGVVAAHLAEVPWLDRLAGRDLYLVGGSWRALARVHMAMADYPLKIIHAYTVEAAAARAFLGRLPGLGKAQLKRIPGVARRVDGLLWAAVPLAEVVRIGKPRRLVFSSYGLREGCLFEQLAPLVRRQDPLLAHAKELASRQARFAPKVEEILAWLKPVLPRGFPDRLVRAAVLLGDIGWQDHPDYRAEHAFWRILRLPVVAIEHRERALLALTVHVRYHGHIEADLLASVRRLLAPGDAEAALTLGLALRLGYTLAGGDSRALADVRLAIEGKNLSATFRGNRRQLAGDVIGRRLAVLSGSLGIISKIK
ncbi:MAG: Ppx/GppA family phosphatase [Alphaproteobacteria bacterium]|nr:Ppx/GppA family phosphatase [Alphaproteobacteria bacterium]